MQIWSAEIKELESLYTSIKGRFPELEKELVQLIETKDTNVVMLYSRRCLEVIITDLCESELKRPRKTEPLKGIIDKLNKEEKVPSHIITSMDHLNSLSTFGAHPKEYDPEQVKPVLLNLITIIKWYLKYKTEKAEPVRMEKVVEHPDKRPVGIKEPVRTHKSFKKPFIIVSGILIVLIILLLVFDPFKFFRKDKFEEIRDPEGKISIVVMPFENQTGDTTLNWFQRGISSLIINGLGNSSELAVCDDNTMFEVMEGMNQVYTAGISPSLAKEVAEKVNAETYISGSFQGREDTYWIMVNLVNTESGNILWTNRMEGNLKSSGYLDLADSLCKEIKNYLEIKALENDADFEFREAFPTSAEAYRYFIEGMNSVLAQNYESGIQLLKKALEIDSTFTFASFYLAYAYCYNYQAEQAAIWTKKTYANKDRVPPKYQPWLELWYAFSFGNSMQDVNRYCDLLAESGINTRLLWFDLGVTYCDFAFQYEKAVAAFDKVMEINLEKGSIWKDEVFYDRYGLSLHKVGKHEQEKEVYEIGLSIFPKSIDISCGQIICSLSMGKTSAANEYISKLISLNKDLGNSESYIEQLLGYVYEQSNIIDKSELHYRKSYELMPQSADRIFWLARFLIINDVNVDEGMELVNKGLDIQPDKRGLLMVKGIGYYKQGKNEEAVQLLSRLWEESIGSLTDLYHYLQDAKQALANQNK
jgi:TolB-like protein